MLDNCLQFERSNLPVKSRGGHRAPIGTFELEDFLLERDRRLCPRMRMP